MSMPGSDLSQPANVTSASSRSACMTVSTESAMTSRDTSDARMPSWPIEMPSLTAMVVNSIGNPPAARTPIFERLASRSSGMLQGVTSFHDEHTPTCGLPQSSSVMPMARSMARAGARSNPSVTSRLRGLTSTVVSLLLVDSGRAPRSWTSAGPLGPRSLSPCFPVTLDGRSLMGSVLPRSGSRPGNGEGLQHFVEVWHRGVVAVRFVLNGRDVGVGDHPHLLAALREELDGTSPKDGCSPSGQCGCCTVLVDGKPTVSCSLTLDRVAGRSVTTLEGLDPAERDRYAATFAATGALQCGFCTPGIVMRAKYLVDKDGAGLTRDKAARHLGGHLCRCTGYHSILDAVDLLASGAEVPVALPAAGVGSANAKYQAGELTLGDKPYVDDLRVPGMLHAAVVLSEHARADIIAIDTAAAEAVAGVERVLTAADVPGELRIGLIHRDWPVFIPVGGRTSYTGDVLALVVAADKATARHAATLVEVDYAPLTPFADALTALASDED